MIKIIEQICDQQPNMHEIIKSLIVVLRREEDFISRACIFSFAFFRYSRCHNGYSRKNLNMIVEGIDFCVCGEKGLWKFYGLIKKEVEF